MEMKARGLLLTRRLSLTDSTFQTHVVKLNEEQKMSYDQSCKLWISLRNTLLTIYEEGLLFQGKGEFARKMSEYWAGHQRFFRAMCSAFKVKEATRLAR